MEMERAAGLLLHVTSLPGRYQCGTLGEESRQFVDFLARAGQRFWQVLPLAPTGYGDSPYSAFSAFAGNDVLISPELLRRQENGAAMPVANASDGPVDYGAARADIRRILAVAAERFRSSASPERRRAYDAFCRSQQHWLDDFALFMALHEHYNCCWVQWPEAVRRREPATLAAAADELSEAVFLHRYSQFVFAEQWRELHAYAEERQVRIIGDLPIFVAYDSADVWANQELFLLDEVGRPLVVAGVPPDYFSRTGQRWGNPLYDWQQLRSTGYAWWRQRMQRALALCDVLRIDHFRGFEACWTIPASAPTAEGGAWVPVPGDELFRLLQQQLGALPLIAEDLGVITSEVEALRDRFAFPGMKILQFAFDSGPENPYLPQNYSPRCVVYTGTHDNTTTLGWWRALEASQQATVREYCRRPLRQMPWEMIEVALASSAAWCIVPVQDLLGLPGGARMNRPGHASGNWTWRCPSGCLEEPLAEKLRAATVAAGRLVN